jgi:hypothetical protein
MGLAEDLLAAVTDVGVAETDMEARVKSKTDALDAQIAALQANPSASQTQAAIEKLQAEKAALVAFASGSGSPPGTTPPGGVPPGTEPATPTA